MSERIDVECGDEAYPVIVDTGGFGHFPQFLVDSVGTPSQMVIVTDTNVEAYCLDGLREAMSQIDTQVSVIVLPAGESEKTIETWNYCVDKLLEFGVSRHTLIVTLGGGVVGDIAGFAAATTLRGIPFIQLPTTLLAMVDSSVGGKTAVNHRLGKNLLGAFHQPKLVYAALDTLRTLPEDEYRSGLGEVVKTAWIADLSLIQLLEDHQTEILGKDPEILAEIIRRCVEIKAEVVAKDTRDHGWRMVLNAGHTVGHALESATNYERWTHGDAVAIGLLKELIFAEKNGWCNEEGASSRLSSLLRGFGFSMDCGGVDQKQLMRAFHLDKKRNFDKITLPLIKKPGVVGLMELDMGRIQELF